jgi:hypothetical protein
MKHLIPFLFTMAFLQVIVGIYVWDDDAWKFIFAGLVTSLVGLFVAAEDRI